MAVQPRSNDELERAIDEIAFEVFHFRLYREISAIAGSKRRILSQPLNYALLLHTRILYDFFYKQPIKDDMKPEAFCRAWEDRKTETGDRKLDLDKRLAHLTWTRVEKPDKPAMNDYADLMAAVEESIVAFEHALRPDLKQKYDDAIQSRKILYLNDPLLAEIV